MCNSDSHSQLLCLSGTLDRMYHRRKVPPKFVIQFLKLSIWTVACCVWSWFSAILDWVFQSRNRHCQNLLPLCPMKLGKKVVQSKRKHLAIRGQTRQGGQGLTASLNEIQHQSTTMFQISCVHGLWASWPRLITPSWGPFRDEAGLGEVRAWPCSEGCRYSRILQGHWVRGTSEMASTSDAPVGVFRLHIGFCLFSCQCRASTRHHSVARTVLVLVRCSCPRFGHSTLSSIKETSPCAFSTNSVAYWMKGSSTHVGQAAWLCRCPFLQPWRVGFWFCFSCALSQLWTFFGRKQSISES